MTVNEQEPREASLAVRVPDPEPEHDRRLLDAVGGLVDQVVDRILLSPDRITSAAEGKRRDGGGRRHRGVHRHAAARSP